MEITERVGIKGRSEQLRKSVPLLRKILEIMEEPKNFPIEIHLTEGDLEETARRTEIVSNLKKIPKPIRISVHIPWRFKGIIYNLAIHEKEVWDNSVEMLKSCLELVESIEKAIKTETVLIAHGYALSEYEKTLEGLKFINRKCDLLKIYDALMSLPLEWRRKIGIETTGTGPCSTPEDLIALAQSTDCFIVQDVAHLMRRFYIDEEGKIHEREYNDLNRLEAGVKEMLPWTRHWHICQHDGGPIHYDGHLADRGILEWPRFIPFLVQSLCQGGTAIVEVRNSDFEKPMESFGSLFLIRSLIKEHFKKLIKEEFQKSRK